MCEIVVQLTEKVPVGNAAATYEALEKVRFYLSYMVQYVRLNRDAGGYYDKILGIIEAALSAPARNCDRPECATSKTAQDVWRKEDGGKTPYYEWLLAPAAEEGGVA